MTTAEGVNPWDFATIFDKFGHFYEHRLTEDEKEELEKFLPPTEEGRKVFNWTLEKTKILLLLRYVRRTDDLKKIISFLDSTKFGWRLDPKDEFYYNLTNRCLSEGLRTHGHCREKLQIKTYEYAVDVTRAVNGIFFDKKYGKTTLFIFSYCLAALFSSMLNSDRFPFPFILQIACDKKTKTYELIREIVGICDVNVGLLDKCSEHYYRARGYCTYNHKTFYPARSVEANIDDLVSNRDIPLIVDGDGNMRSFNVLLREIANIPVKGNYLDLKERFNLLPVFVSSSISHSYENIFNMDLTNLEISDDYLKFLRSKKQLLASWAFEFVASYSDYLFPDDIEARKHKKRYFYHSIRDQIDHINTEYIRTITSDAEHVGFLSFFFKGYLRVVNRLTMLEAEERIRKSENSIGLFNPHKIITGFIKGAERNLSEAHREHSTFVMQRGKIVAEGSLTEGEAIEKAKQWAVVLKDHFKDYKVNLEVLRYEVSGERYLFYVRPMPGTAHKKIADNAENVKHSMGIAFLEVQTIDNSKVIVLSEKPLNENSLTRILESKEFKESKAVIPYAVGYEPSGDMIIADIFEFPHLLIGGTTKSGKSTALYSILFSILTNKNASEVNLLIFDFGTTELMQFNEIPHLSDSIIKDFVTGYKAVLALEKEMNRRILLHKDDRETYGKLPYVVCVIDEFQKFIKGLPETKDRQRLQNAVSNLLTTARGAKIHMVLATQNPTVRNLVIDPANLDGKIALKCSNPYQSKAILGHGGADKLEGKGSMIFQSPDHPSKTPIKGTFIAEKDVEEKLESMELDYEYDSTYKFFIRSQGLELESSTDLENSSKTVKDKNGKNLATSILLALSKPEIAISHIMEKCGMAYPASSKLMRRLYELGLVDEERKNKPRKTIPKTFEEIVGSDELIEILTKSGYSTEDIEETIRSRLS